MGITAEIQLLDYYLLDAQRDKLIKAKMMYADMQYNQECCFYAPLVFESGYYVENGYIHGFSYHWKSKEGVIDYWKEKCAFNVYPEYEVAYVHSSMIISNNDYKTKLLGLSDILTAFDNSLEMRNRLKDLKQGKYSLKEIVMCSITDTIPQF